MGYDWSWGVLLPYADAFAAAAGRTILLTLVAVVIGTCLGVGWALLLRTRHPGWREARLIGLGINDVIRGLPLLILILMVYYFGGPLFGLTSIFWIAVFSLALNLGAFIADVLRGAIDGVPVPYVEAGLAIGLSEKQVLRRIVLPEALRSCVPSVALLYIHILKMSSLASVIAYPELTHVASLVGSAQFRPLEAFALVAAVYLAIVVPLSHVQRRLEKSSWFLRRS